MQEDDMDAGPNMGVIEDILREFLGYNIVDDMLVLDLSYFAKEEFDLYSIEFDLPSL